MRDPMDHAADSEPSAFAPPWVRASNDPRAPRVAGAASERTPVNAGPLVEMRVEAGSAGSDDPFGAAGKLSIDGFAVPRSLDPRFAGRTWPVKQWRAPSKPRSRRIMGLPRFALLVGVVAALAVVLVGSQIWGIASMRPPGGDARTALAALSSAPVSAAPCEDLSEFTEDQGLVEVMLSNPCRKGAVARIEAEGLTLAASFDDNGHARILLPLFHPEVEIRWQAADEAMKNKRVRFSGFRNALRVALIWHDPVDLDLHVVEPGATFGASSGHVSPDHLTSGLGIMHVDGHSQPTGDRVEVYDLPPERNPHEGLFKVYVDVAATDTGARSSPCGELAGPEFQLRILRYGNVDDQNFGFKKGACAAGRAVKHPIKFRDVNAALPG